MYIYKIINKINGKIYVGQTKLSLEKRFKSHVNDIEPSMPINNAIKRYGWENFEIVQIDTASSIEEMNEKEIYWIKELNSIRPNGYNIRTGGDRPPQSFIDNGIAAARRMCLNIVLFNSDLDIYYKIDSSESKKHFCSIYDISKSSVADLFHGRVKKAKGWVLFSSGDRDPQGEAQAGLMSKIRKKTYNFLHIESNQVIEVKDLMEYCIINKLEYVRMSQLSTGKCHEYNGFRSLKFKNKKYKVYFLESPTGDQYVVKNLTLFSETHGINWNTLQMIASQRFFPKSGWKAYKMPEVYDPEIHINLFENGGLNV